MKVHEMISALSKLDPDAEVIRLNSETGEAEAIAGVRAGFLSPPCDYFSTNRDFFLIESKYENTEQPRVIPAACID